MATKQQAVPHSAARCFVLLSLRLILALKLTDASFLFKAAFSPSNQFHGGSWHSIINDNLRAKRDADIGTAEISASVAAPPALTVQDLTCSHNGGETYQLDGVSYVVPRGVKIGLVGRNGCGKSTFLRILADACCGTSNPNDLPYYEGTVTSARELRVAYVEQEPPMPDDSSSLTVSDALLGITTETSDLASKPAASGKYGVYAVVRRYHRAMRSMTIEQHGDENDGNNVDKSFLLEASQDMDACDGWSVLVKAEQVATRLRVQHLQDVPLAQLSGGERKRVALAAALTQEPDVLLMDEPTNHLDLPAIRWLSDLLKENKGLTALIVTHDRAFLEDVCTQILELDQGSLYRYDGSYSAYLEGKQSRFALQDAAVSAAKAKYRVELEWMRRQPQARESKSKARIEAFYKLQKATQPRPREHSLTLANDDPRRLGGNILKLKNVSLKFGDRVMLDNFSYDFCRGDRIGIVGANGVGKSTLIGVLSGTQPINHGQVEKGETLVMGVYDQMGLSMDQYDPTMTMLEFVLEQVKTHDQGSMAESPDQARKFLQQFEFPRSRWNQRVSVLSGGEKRRLQLLSVFAKRPNFLVLDEPSNDIDLDTLTALESYLVDTFQGVLVVVSHDRCFTDKVTDHLFVLEGNGVIKDFTGSLSEFADCLEQLEDEMDLPTNGQQQQEQQDSSSSNPEAVMGKKATMKLNRQKRNEVQNNVRKWKKESNSLESSIDKLREVAISLENEIEGSSDQGWSVLADLTAQLQTVAEEIDEKEMRWLELAELLEEAEQQTN